jgi:hypothetical protein
MVHASAGWPATDGAVTTPSPVPLPVMVTVYVLVAVKDAEAVFAPTKS